MANEFNNFFVNIGNTVENKIPKGKKNFKDFLKNSALNSIFLNPVTEKEVFEMLTQINSKKSCGPNSIPSNLLKTHAVSFIEPVKLMINQSLSDGIFPNILKAAQVCPIFKKGENHLRENYRPISLLSNLSKLLREQCTPEYIHF